ncbi:MAG TPA: dephospho-CoA kinase [Hadesarchaea archaeon]|nr:dephospho-CoA kinase [Hadesarchaea archaeon]
MVLKVIGIVGPQGSGKTEVAKILTNLGVPCVRMGNVVWEEVRRRGLEITETNVAKIAVELREREGLGAVAKRCIPLIKAKGEGKPAVVVDGIRGEAEVNEFRRTFYGDFRLIAVQSEEKIRYSRVASRGRVDDADTQEKFREKDRRESSWGLDNALTIADFTIVNEGTLEDLHRKAVEIYRKVVGEKV